MSGAVGEAGRLERGLLVGSSSSALCWAWSCSVSSSSSSDSAAVDLRRRAARSKDGGQVMGSNCREKIFLTRASK